MRRGARRFSLEIWQKMHYILYSIHYILDLFSFIIILLLIYHRNCKDNKTYILKRYYLQLNKI